MSHFLTLVLVSETEPDPESRARELMLPYFAPDRDTPQSRCDGFTIGGKYDGLIWGKEQHYNLRPSEYQERYGLDVVTPEDNIRPVSALLPDLVPYAIVTPDGLWHDRDGMTPEQWSRRSRSLLQQYREGIAVAIDCHY